MKIFAHRGNLDGKKIENENSVNALINALIYGFDLEFDINFDMKRQNMILSNDISKRLIKNMNQPLYFLK